MDKKSLLLFEKQKMHVATRLLHFGMFNRCHPPRYWSPRARSRCPSVVGTLRCQRPVPTLGPNLPQKLRRATQAAIRPPIPTGSFCSRCRTAPSQTAAAPVSSWLAGRCPSSRRPRPGRSAGGCLPRCWSGSCPRRTRCLTQCASYAPPRRPIPTRCPFVWRRHDLHIFWMFFFLFLGVAKPTKAPSFPDCKSRLFL